MFVDLYIVCVTQVCCFLTEEKEDFLPGVCVFSLNFQVIIQFHNHNNSFAFELFQIYVLLSSKIPSPVLLGCMSKTLNPKLLQMLCHRESVWMIPTDVYVDEWMG